jgi:F0F1-type ATP synthase membrane subunit b/b'
VDQQIVNWLFVGFGASVGWVLKVVWDAIQDLKTDLRTIERDLPEVYVRRDDFKDAVHEIKTEMREMRQDMKVGFKHVDDTLNILFEKITMKEDRNAR